MDVRHPFVIERRTEKIELLDAGRDGFYFTLTHGLELVFVSRFFETKAQALIAIESLRRNVGKSGFFDRKMSPDGKLYFVFKCSEGVPIGQSLPHNNASCIEAYIELLGSLLIDTETVDLTIIG